jgi:cell division protease FtsH
LLDGAYSAARRVLVEHREQLETLASALLEHETLDAAALQSLLAGPA